MRPHHSWLQTFPLFTCSTLVFKINRLKHLKYHSWYFTLLPKNVPWLCHCSNSSERRHSQSSQEASSTSWITAAGLSAGVQMEVRLTLCHGENNLEGEATDVLGTVEETYEECLSAGSSLRESCESKIWVESSGIGHVETVEKTESKHGRFPKGKISINKDMQWWWSTGLSGERWVNED